MNLGFHFPVKQKILEITRMKSFLSDSFENRSIISQNGLKNSIYNIKGKLRLNMKENR